MSNDATPAGIRPDAPETITVTLPRMEDYAQDFARVGRMMQAMGLAGELTPEGFSRWMEHGKAIRSGTTWPKEPAPSD